MALLCASRATPVDSGGTGRCGDAPSEGTGLRLHLPHDSGRAEVEDFIREVYARCAWGASASSTGWRR